MTQKLYHDDSYQMKFEAKILEQFISNEKFALILDQTCFYPEAGGQTCDKGMINGIPVLDVQEENGNIIHYLRDDLHMNSGEYIHGEIDWKERFDHMQQHSGQHILSATLIELYQKETQSFHMGKEICTLDIPFVSLGDQQTREIEKRANQIIYENRPIDHYYLDDTSKIAEKNIRKAQKNHERLRIIEIKNYDVTACGGTHCSSTGEIGMIKIIGYEKQKENLRISFVCGYRALRDYQMKNTITNHLSRIFTTGIDCLEEYVIRLSKEKMDLSKQYHKIEKKVHQLEADDLKRNNLKEKNGIVMISKLFSDQDLQSLKEIASVLTNQENYVAILGTENPEPIVCIACSKNLFFRMDELIKEITLNYQGKGGGSRFIAMTRLERKDDIRQALKMADDLISGQNH
ncbi:MAG: hypothetical protein JXC36_05095 [Candidatus Atribacteria bacterium]|nr:hypothetical protein [Candidatus Atribacteria bacterium]